MVYKYEFKINGVVQREVVAHFRQNIIAEIVNDLNDVTHHHDSIEFIVTKGTVRYVDGKIIFE